MNGNDASSWLAAALALTVLAGASFALAQAPQPAAHSKVLIQVSDAGTANWNLALNNAHNIQSDLGAANVDVEIVAYGPGIGMLKLDSAVSSRVGEATAAGVKIVACEHTMQGQRLARGDMLNGIP